MAALLAGILTILLAAPAGSGWSFQWAAADTKQERAKPSGRPGARVPGWIHQRFIAFGPRRKRQMAAYSKRHYGVRQWRLREPKQIVEHVAVASTVGQVIHAFVPNRPDPEFHETPNVCAHFVISGSGRVVQLVPVGIRCRHVVGLNQVAIGIEHTGFSDGDVLGNRRQMRSSIRLTKWLRCRYDIGIRDVIGHRESLGSRFHRELVPSMKYQTHGDFRHSSMSLYRRELHGAGRCIQ
ncbi:MAG TPA: peptidoglycan recognition family protein [Solirubrobacterales bacterium]|nr:peptidoglycan recognition family protein [Solirubrobacterales bacterium]